jgi:hypothetical protein
MSRWSSTVTPARLGWLALALAVSLAALLRLGLVDVPLERDEGEYAYAGQLMLQGIAPYQSACNMKLPGIYAAYAAILKLFGQTHQGIHRALILVNALTVLFLFLLARRIMGSLGAAAAAACFLLLSAGQSVQGVFANAEHFVILFAVAGLYLLLAACDQGGAGRIFAAGLLLGTAFIMKQHGIAFGATGAATIAGRMFLHRPAAWRVTRQQLAWYGAGWLCPYLVVCGLLFQAGVFDVFWFWTVEYARTYVTQLPLRHAWLNFYENGSAVVQSGVGLWCLTGLGAAWLPWAKIEKQHKLLLIFFVFCSLLAITPGFFFRPHYFVLLIPCAALLAGLGLAQGVARLSRGRPTALRYTAAACVLLASLGQSLYVQRDYFFTLSPFQVARATYWLNPFSESLPVADYIRRHTQAGDRIAVLGSEPQIYFYAQRRSVNGFIYMYPLMENHAFALKMQQEFVRTLEREQPKYVVFVSVPTTWLLGRDSHRYLFEWFDHYQKKNLQLVGTVALYDDRSEYHWDADVKWPADSRFWVAVFKNRGA